MMVDRESRSLIDDSSVIYRKSGLGAAELASSRTGPLSARERQVLILLDGRRTVEELSEFFGAEAVLSLIAGLEKKGFAKRVDPALPPEWANSVTRILVDRPDEPKAQAASAGEEPVTRWHHDWFALVNVGMLALVVLMLAGVWAVGQRPTTKVMPFGETAQSVTSIDAHGAVKSPDEGDGIEPEVAATSGIRPLSHLTAIGGPKPATGSSPAHASPQGTANARQGTVSGDSPGRAP
jgi:hypothetical protein